MYDSYYSYIKNKYGAKAQLLFTDTNDLMYEIEAENVYEDKEDKIFTKTKYYLSLTNQNHYQESKYYDKINDLIFGKMQEETRCVPINYFVELNAKMYIYITEEDHECKTNISNSVVKDGLKDEDYKNILLFNATDMRHEMKRFQSKSHNIRANRTNEVSLTFYNDKKYMIEDGHYRLSYFYKSTR